MNKGRPESGLVLGTRRRRRISEGRAIGDKRKTGVDYARLLRKVLLVADVTRHAVHHDTPVSRACDFHSFRRAFCTIIAASGVNVQTAMSLAGHSSESTHQRYVPLSQALTVPDAAIPTVYASQDRREGERLAPGRYLSRPHPLARSPTSAQGDPMFTAGEDWDGVVEILPLKDEDIKPTGHPGQFEVTVRLSPLMNDTAWTEFFDASVPSAYIPLNSMRSNAKTAFGGLVFTTSEANLLAFLEDVKRRVRGTTEWYVREYLPGQRQKAQEKETKAEAAQVELERVRGKFAGK